MDVVALSIVTAFLKIFDGQEEEGKACSFLQSAYGYGAKGFALYIRAYY